MKIWKVILAACVIFAAGVVTGGLTVKLKSRPAAPAKFPPQIWGQRLRGDLMERMSRQLDLTAEQRSQIEQVVQESQERTKALWDAVAPQAHEEHRRVRERIRDILQPEQRAAFERAFKARNFARPAEPRKQDPRRIEQTGQGKILPKEPKRAEDASQRP